MLKGRTMIELTDVKTKQTEVYQKNNLVTNAVADILSQNPSGLLYPLEGSRTGMNQELFPIANACYGGILLFEDSLIEDTTQYYPPVNNDIVGYASNDVNGTDNPKRGSLNLSESTIIDGGYKFVWDFSTSQANGLISSLALTHYSAGKSFYGDSHAADGRAIMLNRVSPTMSKYEMAVYLCMVEANPIDNTFVSIIPNADKTIDVIRVKEPMTSLGLNDSLTNLSSQTLDSVTLAVDAFFEGISSTNQVNFFDGKDGYWYGFTRATDSKNNKTILNRLRVNKEDYSTTVNQWELDGIIMVAPGSYHTNSYGYFTRTNNSLLYGKYLYIFSSDAQIIYKINIYNPVDIISIELGFKSNYSAGDNTSTYIYQWGNYICGYDFVINQEDRVIRTSGHGLSYVSTPLIGFGPLCLGYTVNTHYSNGTFSKTLYLHSPYLGTINNLETPILKTADKTMKITYTLTETEESV
ncbi:hypothetical protein [Facklamia lactis]|uniref:hypothetical protein n=1 Tax=Facklamia lactis TaxID=2749967 RepID=UPI0018CD6AD4|nr:hypothetical protein [Facklamia lactis]MBG9980436.1 hypothetical protein [Facklamia lactis]